MDEKIESQKPKQAVVLAGGRGTRLAPITDTIPKPMVPFHGKPFLEYLIEYLKSEGFDRILLLLGYRAEQIEDYFGDGSRFGVHIDYSITDVENETGPRLLAARDKIDPLFFLVYCDNYCPLDTAKMWQLFLQKKPLAQITVYANLDQYTRSNLKINDHQILLYDKTKTEPELNGVDIGFAFIQKKVLDHIPKDNINFEKIVYPKLVLQKQLNGYMTQHRYYSVGNLERLPMTEKFLKREPVIFLDRDGVLNQKAAKGEYVTKPEDFIWKAGAIDAIRLLKQKGYLIAMISNQAGIARGRMSEADLGRVHKKMQSDLSQHQVQIDAIYYCPHDWDQGCFCRKPKPGMLFQAQKDLCCDLSRVYFIGDDERDIQAAEAAGCRSYLIQPDESLKSVIENIVFK